MNTRKTIWLVALSWLILTGVGVARQAPAGDPARKKRVAVMDFDYATVHSGIAGLFGRT